MSTISPFRSIENKHDVYRGTDRMKKFCEFLRECAVKIINFKEKKWSYSIKEQQESYEKPVIFLKKNLKMNMWKIKIS